MLEKIKNGLITGLQSLGIFILMGAFSGLYPYNIVIEWISFIIIIGTIYIFIAKSRSLAKGIVVGYILLAILVFGLTGGFVSMANGFKAWTAEAVPKLVSLLEGAAILVGCVIVLYVVIAGTRDNTGTGKHVIKDPGIPEEPYDPDPEPKPRYSPKKREGIQSGSDEYWKIREQAERIYWRRVKARSSSEREIWIRNGNEMADRLREKYGFDDKQINYLINEFYLDYTS